MGKRKGAAVSRGKTGTFSTERANRLRAVLKEKGLTEAVLLGQINKASTKGMTYKRIEDVPEGLDKRISEWITKAEATRPTPPTGLGGAVAEGAGENEFGIPRAVKGAAVADPGAEARAKVQRNFERGAMNAGERDAMLQQIELSQPGSGGVRADVGAPKTPRSRGGKGAPKVGAEAVGSSGGMEETGRVGRGFAGAGPQEPPKVGRKFRKQPVAMPEKVVPGVMGPVGKAPGTFGVGGGGALGPVVAGGRGGGGVDAKGLRDMLGAGGGGGVAGKVAEGAGKFSRLARVLGPIGIAFGVYEIMSRLKGQTVDRADEERLRVMEALSSMGRGVQEEGAGKDALGQQGMMVGMAGMQRQRDLDAMRRVYTGNAEMNNLIRSNEDLLASIAMPSQPSVAELMARI